MPNPSCFDPSSLRRLARGWAERSAFASRFAIAVACVLALASAPARAGLDLTWSACNRSAAGRDDIAFDCANPAFRASLFGNFQVPDSLASFVAMDAVIDIAVGADSLVPFWHFENGGCNPEGLTLYDDRPSLACPAADNDSPWGANGGAADAVITAYGVGYGGSNRARLLLTLARLSSDPIRLVRDRNYFGFQLDFQASAGSTCEGCDAPADVSWNSATFYAVDGAVPLHVTSPGLRSNSVTVNGGVGGLSIATVSPAAGDSGDAVAVVIAGRSIEPGATVRLTRAGSADVLGATDSVYAGGRALAATLDLRGASGGLWDVVVTNPGGAEARLTDAFRVVSGLRLAAVHPVRGYARGPVTVTIEGREILAGAQALLRREHEVDVPGQLPAVASDGSSMDVTFGIAGARPGAWDVVVVNPTGPTATLPAAFEVLAQPRISFVVPNRAADTGSVAVKITGSGLLAPALVRLTAAEGDTIIGDSVTVAPDSASIRARFTVERRRGGSWNVEVVQPDGVPLTLPGGFVILETPRVAAITPNRVGDSQPARITITGSGFQIGTIAVLTHEGEPDIPATSLVSTVDGRSMTGNFEVTGRRGGAWDLFVASPNGLVSRVPGGVTIQTDFVVRTVNPPSAPDSSVLAIEIGGGGFQPGATARLARAAGAPIEATDASFIDTGTLRCRFDLRGRPTGAWDVQVINPDSAIATLVNGFRITGVPYLDSVAPAVGGDGDTILVKFYGKSLGADVRPSLNRAGDFVIIIPGTVNSASLDGTSMMVGFNLRQRPLGFYDVIAARPDAPIARLPAGFQIVRSPRITAVVPRSAPDTGLVRIGVVATDLAPGARLRLEHVIEGPLEGIDHAVVGDTAFATFDLRGHSGRWSLRVTNPNGVTGILFNSFDILSVPHPTGMAPTRAGAGESIVVQVYGRGFDSGAGFRLRREGVPDVVGIDLTYSGTTLISGRLSLQGAPPGYWDLQVVNPNGLVGTFANAFEVRPAVRIDAVTPALAADTGRVELTVSGGRFLAGATATLNRAAAAIPGENVQVHPAGDTLTATFTLRGRPSGGWNLTVLNPDGVTSTKLSALTIAAVPQILTTIPDHGGDGEVLVLAIRGGRFLANMTARLRRDGEEVVGSTSTVSAQGETLRTTLDLRHHTPGDWDVLVGNQPGFDGRLANGFRIVPGPLIERIQPQAAADTGTARITLIGRGFVPGTIATLERADDEPIRGVRVSISAAGDSMSADFSLRNRSWGAWTLRVVDPAGSSSAVPDGFTIQLAPRIFSVTPSHGTDAEVLTVRVDGLAFEPLAAVRLVRAGSADIPGSPTAIGSETQLSVSFDLRDRATGLWDLWVINPSGLTGIARGGFEILAVPIINEVSPHIWDSGAMVDMVVLGRKFLPSAATRLSASGHADILGQVTRVAPTGDTLLVRYDLRNTSTGVYDVLVKNLEGSSARLSRAFEIRSGPAVATISPRSAQNHGLISLRITGTDFLPGATVKLARPGDPDIPGTAPIIDITGTTMTSTFDLTDRVAGLWNIVVTNPTGSVGTLALGFTIVPTADGSTSGIDLTWNTCNKSTSPGADDVTFDCGIVDGVSTVYGNFQLGLQMPGMVAMDAIVDLAFTGSTVPPFWQLSDTGCNAGGAAVSDNRPDDLCPPSLVANPWGTSGSAADGLLTGYSAGYGGPGHARLLLTVARASSNPITIQAAQNYFGFGLSFLTEGAGACAGCNAPAMITWSQATFYSVTPGIVPVVVTEPGLRGNIVTTSGGLGRIAIGSVAPARATALGVSGFKVHGRGFVDGARVTVGDGTSSATAIFTASADGRMLSGFLDLSAMPGGSYDLTVANPDGATDRRALGVEVVPIVPPSVHVLFPNGGESFAVGDLFALQWQATDNGVVTSVDLLISRAGPDGPYEMIAEDVQPTGSFAWSAVAPGTIGSTCYFKVIAYDDDGNAGQDRSDRGFRIVGTTPALLSRFEAAPVADGIEIVWSFGEPARIATVALERAPDAGGPWTAIDAARRDEAGATVAIDRGVEPGASYAYRLTVTDRDGATVRFGPLAVTAGGSRSLALALALAPNPTSSGARVDFTLPEAGAARLAILDIQGREIARLADGPRGAGRHQAFWTGEDARGARAPVGLYFVRLETAGTLVIRRLVVTR